jgi:hypothetical protein
MISIANTDEGTTSAPTDVNTTEQLRGPLGELQSLLPHRKVFVLKQN